MRPFDLQEPTTLEGALQVLAHHGEDARPLAGGQSLLVLLRQRLVFPEVLVALRGVAELHGIGEMDDGLRVAGMTTYAATAASPVVRGGWPLLSRAAGLVGSIHIRERGTVGGSVSHSDPAGDIPVALIALGGSIETAGPSGTRLVPAEDFPAGLFTTNLEPGALVAAIRVPTQPAGASFGYRRFSVRDGEYPMTQCAVRMEWRDGACVAARIAVGGGDDRPIRLDQLEGRLVGLPRDPSAATSVAAQARDLIHCFDDVRGSADWKARVVTTMIGRAIGEAMGEKESADA